MRRIISVFAGVYGLSCVAFGADGLSAEEALKKFTVTPGFEVKTWAAEPLLANPVSFTFDEQGRAFVAETYRLNNSVFDITQNTNWLRDDLALENVEDRAAYMSRVFGTNVNVLQSFSERLRMVVDSDKDGQADQGQTIAENFREVESGLAAGVLAAGTNLYFTCIPDLWKFIDSNGDGIADEGKKLHSGFGVHIGVTGHDLHGLAMGPDGRIYFSIGDRAFNVRKEGLAFPHTGGVLRCEPDGSNLEVYATGMRNPQELAFDQYGNLFTGDNDTAGPDNSRLLYVVLNGDYGWRFSYQHMNDFGPWVLEKLWEGGQDGMLPHSGDAAQGPSGIAYYPGTGLPAEYANHFFICDFPGGIWSFAVKSSGAGFEIADKKKFLWNAWPTDVEFGPSDGIFFSDWVGGWTMPEKGRIYQVRANERGTPNFPTGELLARDFSKSTEAELAGLLSFADLRIRQKAQFELAKRGAVETLSTVLKGGSQMARIHALWGLGQGARKHQGNVSSDLITRHLADPDPEIRAQAARLLGEVRHGDSAPSLRRLLSDESTRVRFFAAEALGAIRDRASLPDLLKLAQQTPDDAFLLHPIVMAVAAASTKADLEKYGASSDAAVRRVILLAMRRNGDPAIRRFLADESLRVEAARAINDVPIADALPALAMLLEQGELPAPVLLRALNANFRLGTDRAARRLGEFARRVSAQAEMRAEAVRMLGTWERPDPVDRVVGLWRPLPDRDPGVARGEVSSIFAAFSGEGESGFLSVLLDAVRELACQVESSALVRLFDDEKLESWTRIKALETLAELSPEQSKPAILKALDSRDDTIRLLACRLAAKTQTSELINRVTHIALTDPSVLVRQKAVLAIAGRDTDETVQALQRLVAELRNGKLADRLHLELLSAVESSGRPEVKAIVPEVQRLAARALLAGGDRDAGSRIFYERADVSCLRCHAVRGNGGTVGPDLAGIGGKQSREYLIEAIQDPNKAIASGYEQVVVRRKDGTTVAGLVVKETPEILVIDSPEDGRLELVKVEIETRNRNLSAMPEGLGGMLSREEMRDLIEFLANL